ncbi:hypothetical protein K8T06_03765 [bacterium]|nr:hypothetical protein [bacterium]
MPFYLKKNKPIIFIITILTIIFSHIKICKAYDIEDEYGFASQLIASKDYEQAILSLRRYTLFGENPDNLLKARFIVSSLYAQLDRHDRAVSCFLEIARDDSQADHYRERAAFLAIQSMFLNKDPANYHVHLDKLDSMLNSLSQEGFEQRQYMKGFLGVYAGSSELIDLLPVETNNMVLRSHSEILRQQFDFWNTHPRKNPATAGILSVLIPGAGQIYNGRYWDGGVAMGLILGGAYWTHDLFERGDDNWGWTVGVVTGLLYFGQIRNSIIDAVRINERAELEFKKHLVEEYFLKFTLSVKEDDIRFGITF